MSDVIIRQAELDELPRIAALKKQIHDVHVAGRPDLFTPYSSLDAFADHSAAKGCALLLAEEAGEPVGSAFASEGSPPSGHVTARVINQSGTASFL